MHRIAVQIIRLPSHKSQWYGIDTQSEPVKTFIYFSFYIYINCAITRYSNLSLLYNPTFRCLNNQTVCLSNFPFLVDFSTLICLIWVWSFAWLADFISFCDPALVIPFKTLLKYQGQRIGLEYGNVLILCFFLSNSALIFSREKKFFLFLDDF